VRLRRLRRVLPAIPPALVGLLAAVGGCRVNLRFVETLTARPPASPSPDGPHLRDALDRTSLERDVRRLASRELEGRGRGTRGSALAREHLVQRLRGAGLEPLFSGSFEQPTFPRGRDPYATNVGALRRSSDPDAEWIALLAHYDHRGIVRGKFHPGADDNASGVAILLAIADAVGRLRPTLPHHVAFVFPDAEEPPDTRSSRMGSSWFWRHPPFPIERLRCAVVLDLMGGLADPAARGAGLDELLFVLGGEAHPGLARIIRATPAEPGVEPLPMSLAMIETYPYLPGRRFSVSDYDALRPLGRPFLFLSTGRTHRYHTAEDTADALDYEGLAARARWCALLAERVAAEAREIGWEDGLVDARADARAAARLFRGIGGDAPFPALLRRALLADRRRVEAILTLLESGAEPSRRDYRALQLACLRLQAAIWHPRGWWFALW